jgi:ABC-type lipoprotein export system ATPase subunit
LDIIKQFKKEKQAIIIITHDKDVYPMFDDHIDLENSNNIGSFSNT